MRKCRWFIAFPLLVASSALVAEEPAATCAYTRNAARGANECRCDGCITVLATGTSEGLHATGQPVTVIGADEIRQVQGPDITRVLERAPGVAWSRNGGPGSFTGVRVRGADAEQLLVLVDGVKVADPAAPGGGFDFGTLLPAGLARIELLRGSNGTIWGSQAIGGVLAASTAFATGLEADAEYGARDTLYSAAAAGLERGPLQLSANGAWYRTDGFSAATAGREPDGLRQWQAGAAARLAVGPRIHLRGSARYSDSRLELDGFPPPDYALADTDEAQVTRQLAVLAGFEYTSAGLDLTGNWSAADTARDSFDSPSSRSPSYSTRGHSDRLDVRGAARAGPVRLWFGGEGEWTRFSTSFDARHSASLLGAYGQLGTSAGRLTIDAGARVADHSRFGMATTFGADASWRLGHGWFARASFGEGFKAPTLFQLYSDYGNRALQPERSTSGDVGIELGDRNARYHLALTLFRRDSEGLIDFVSCFGQATGVCTARPFGTYANVGRARAQGVELEAAAELLASVRGRLAYSFVDARDRTPGSAAFGRALARRPRHTLSAGAEWPFARSGASLGADLRWSSASFDDAANLVRLPAYAVIDVTAECPLTSRIGLYGRIENLGNARYQTAAGYASPPRGVFVGVRVRS